MSNPIPDQRRPHPFQHYIDEMDVQLHRFVAAIGQNPERLADFMTFLARDLEEQEFVLMSTEHEFAKLWDQIRSGPQVWTDFVLEITSALIFRARGEDILAFSKLAEAVAAAFGCMRVSPTNKVLAADDSLDRFAESSKVGVILNNNPWAVALYLVRQTDFVIDHLTAAALATQEKKP